MWKLKLSMLVKISTSDNLKYCSFLQKISIDISCRLSPQETIWVSSGDNLSNLSLLRRQFAWNAKAYFLTFHADCLLRRQFARNAKAYFLEKIRKKHNPTLSSYVITSFVSSVFCLSDKYWIILQKVLKMAQVQYLPKKWLLEFFILHGVCTVFMLSIHSSICLSICMFWVSVCRGI